MTLFSLKQSLSRKILKSPSLASKKILKVSPKVVPSFKQAVSSSLSAPTFQKVPSSIMALTRKQMKRMQNK